MFNQTLPQSRSTAGLPVFPFRGEFQKDRVSLYPITIRVQDRHPQKNRVLLKARDADPDSGVKGLEILSDQRDIMDVKNEFIPGRPEDEKLIPELVTVRVQPRHPDQIVGRRGDERH